MKTQINRIILKILSKVIICFIVIPNSNFLTIDCVAQGVGINVENTPAAPSAILDVSSTAAPFKGLLIPRLSTVQRDLITSPAQALLIYNTTTKCFEFWEDGIWQTMKCAECTTPSDAGTISGTATVCQGQNGVVYSVPVISGAVSYVWSYSGVGATIIGTTNSISINFSSSASSGNLTVIGTNDCGSGTASAIYSITVDSIPDSAIATAGTGATSTQITANWNTSTGAIGYSIDVATDLSFANIVTGYDNLNVNNVLSYTITGLSCGTTYYYRIRAYNSCDTSSYSNIITYTTTSCYNCGTPFTDVRDGQSYTTVLIDNKCWMKQNLNIGTMINNTVEATNNGTFEKYCYDNLASNCTTYGGLYEWAEAVQYYNGATNTASWSTAPTGNLQGICPDGWHLPTQAEWISLFDFLGGSSVAGGPMKEAGTAHWNSPNTGATNSSGFTAFGSGFRYAATSFGFDNLKGTANFWSASEGTTPAGQAWNYIPAYNWVGVNLFSSQKALGYSVRCIKD